MRYSTEPRDRIQVKGSGFLSFAKNMGKNLSNKYSQKLLHSAKQSTADPIKTTSKRAIQKTAEATGDLIGNKLLIKQQVFQKILQMNYKKMKQKQAEPVQRTYQKKIYISPEERQQIIDELRLV